MNVSIGLRNVGNDLELYPKQLRNNIFITFPADRVLKIKF
jgi:hypothetical protein